MLKDVLIQEGIRLQALIGNLDEGDYGSLYLLLKRSCVVVDLAGYSLFDDSFHHIFKSAKGYLDYLPDEKNTDVGGCFAGLKRDLEFVIPHLIFHLKQ